MGRRLDRRVVDLQLGQLVLRRVDLEGGARLVEVLRRDGVGGHQRQQAAEIGLRVVEVRLGRGHERDEVGRVELRQHLALGHGLVVFDVDVGDHAGDARRDVVQVPGDVGVVGLLVGVGVVDIEAGDDRDDDGGRDQQRMAVTVDEMQLLPGMRGAGTAGRLLVGLGDIGLSGGRAHSLNFNFSFGWEWLAGFVQQQNQRQGEGKDGRDEEEHVAVA